MEKRKKIFVQSIFPAPYRTEVFKYLSEACDLFVAFERNTDTNRNSKWFTSEFGYKCIIIDNAESVARYDEELQNLWSYDCVLAYDYATVSSLKLLLKCIVQKIPFYINLDGSFTNRHLLKDMIKRPFISRARACLASGEYAKRYFLTYGAKEEDIYFHNFTSLNENDILTDPVGSEEKTRLRQHFGLPMDKKIIMSVGQFTHRKGFDVLLKAWGDISKDFHLIIIGGGEDGQLYLELINQNRFKNVSIIDFQHHNILFNYYKSADLFVLPTREDIWGLVINEAMACGLPVVTTNRCIAGLELVEDGVNGYIVPVENGPALIKGITSILDDEMLTSRISKNNLNKMQGITCSNIARSHLEVLNKTL